MRRKATSTDFFIRPSVCMHRCPFGMDVCLLEHIWRLMIIFNVFSIFRLLGGPGSTGRGHAEDRLGDR